ncbi:MAG: hypothetical protein FWG38_04605 [Defluviitaleaceae bacterium]|nr:hypothetical protein [Defluviitaleaceae bacterium]
MDHSKITALRMQRQHLTHPANEAEYIPLYRDLQPGQNVYWYGFGQPPSLTYRATFDDIAYNRKRQYTHALLKGRFTGGNLGWIVPDDLALFAGAFRKPLTKPKASQTTLLELIEREPLTIQQIKEETGWLVKEITPILHRLQEAFLIYEDQFDGEWDRGWHGFSSMFPDVDVTQYPRHDALMILLQRFAYRQVAFDVKMAKSFYKLPEKDITKAIDALTAAGILTAYGNSYMLETDRDFLKTYNPPPLHFVLAMQRNDFLVKSNDYWLKEKFAHPYPDTLCYIMVDGIFCGAVAGKFRYSPAEVEDVMVDLPPKEAAARKNEILQAVRGLFGEENPIKRYMGVAL